MHCASTVVGAWRKDARPPRCRQLTEEGQKPKGFRLRNREARLDSTRPDSESSRRNESRSGCVRPAYSRIVSTMSLPRRAAQAVAESPVSERVADAQEFVYAPVLDLARRSALHSDVLGHSLHPVLTDLTLGCWTSATLLDIVGGPASRHAAALLTSAGVAVAIPTAVAGAADWSEMTGSDRRVGAVHALGTDIATFLFVGSLVARLRGRHVTGVRLGAVANLVMVGAGFLGGHLALNRGAARRER